MMVIKEINRNIDGFNVYNQDSYDITFGCRYSDFEENEIGDIIQNKNVSFHFVNIFFRQLDIEDKTKLILELQKQVFEDI